MEPREIINNIKEEFSEFSLTNQNQLNFLEDVRKSIIESIKLKKNESITNLIKFIRNNSIKDEIIEFNNFKLLFSTIYFDKDTILNKSESKYNTLEISVEGKKIFKIFEENTNKFIEYKLMPIFGIVYSKKTPISGKVFSDSCLISINLKENES
tara:strand:- start:776 stop:1237 length:462 start_codon:yes stop_codon:yes gene_type:complete